MHVDPTTPASLNPQKLARPRVPALALSIEDAALSLGLSPDSIRELIRCGKLAHVRAGARVVVSVRAIQRYLDAESSVEYRPAPRNRKGGDE